MSKAIFVTKARGNQEPFSISKLKRSMFDTGASKEVIDQIFSFMIEELMDKVEDWKEG